MERLAETLIIPAGPGDAIDLAEVHVRAWRETYPGHLPAAYLAKMSIPAHARRWRHQLMRVGPGDVVLAAEGPGGLAGYAAGAMVAGFPGEAEIFTLYLLRSHQKIGLGRRLMEAAARALAAQGAKSLRVWVLSSNEGARRFYAHLGGIEAAERPVRGWGGNLMETAYHWRDVGELSAG